MIEEWSPIKGYEDSYEISNTAKVRAKPRVVGHSFGESAHLKGLERKQHNRGNGYLFVALWKNNKGITHLVHRMVAEAFIPNPDRKPFINHKDGVKTNNNVENLEWCTKSENAIHAFRMGLIKKKFYGEGPKAVKVINTETGEITTSIKELSERLNMSYYSLRNQIVGRSPNNTIYRRCLK
jgi:hypothetical protein